MANPIRINRPVVASLLFLFCLLALPFSAAASEPLPTNQIGNHASFDLTESSVQTRSYELPNGETATLGLICEDEPSPQWDSRYPNASGTWTVYYNSPVIYREFKIHIANSSITNAWGQNYSTLGCTVTGESFKWNSKQATYRLNYETLGLASSVAVLQATIEGTTLHTYAN